jgi:hypothetical protein
MSVWTAFLVTGVGAIWVAMASGVVYVVARTQQRSRT